MNLIEVRTIIIRTEWMCEFSHMPHWSQPTKILRSQWEVLWPWFKFSVMQILRDIIKAASVRAQGFLCSGPKFDPPVCGFPICCFICNSELLSKLKQSNMIKIYLHILKMNVSGSYYLFLQTQFLQLKLLLF